MWIPVFFLLFLRPPNFMKQYNAPVCIYCKHFIPKETDILTEPVTNSQNVVLRSNRYGLCSLFWKKDMVTGVIKHDYALTCRSLKSMCGETGKYYEPKFPPKNETL